MIQDIIITAAVVMGGTAAIFLLFCLAIWLDDWLFFKRKKTEASG